MKIIENFFLNIKRYNKAKIKKETPENILLINTNANHGGAARAAYDMLCSNLKDFGFKANILCKQSKIENDDKIIVLKSQSLSTKITGKLFNYFGYLDLYHNTSKIKRMECFKNADVIHLHNLHGKFFNPLFLPELTALKPTIWTLHDEQSFTGHCAYSFDCNKWQTGCNTCHDLNYYPSISKDKTDFLLKLKKDIYKKSDFTVVTPSNWLKLRAEKSILKGKDIRCIYNGIDENLWKPYEKDIVREELNLPLNKKILLFLADCSISNPQKGGEFVLDTIEYFKNKKDIVFLIIGNNSKVENPNVISKNYIYSSVELAKYYSSADLLIFPTLADNLPFVIMEAMACATPVVSFNIGGVSEEIEHLKSGYLADYKDLKNFIKGIELLLNDDALRYVASKNAREQFLKKFTLKKCLENYTSLYKEIFFKRK